ncbi:hypothetical protein SpCBS45565_g02344 [Spizellomyces sp. 'palustris']|nr:hypothetical protein SpCBS45565_g02344 [Spizellomyces sp. 'palustris']
MASKEATVLIVDVNPSMRTKKEEGGKTNHQRAHEALFQILHSKIIPGRKTDQVALLLVGTEESDNILAEGEQYQHIKAYSFEEDEAALFRQPDLELLKYVERGTEEGTANGDVIDAIILGLHMLEQHCRKLKYEKKIYVFTDAENPVDTEGSDAVAEKVKELGVTFNLIGYDFDDPDHGIKHEHKSDVKAINEEFLRGFTERAEGNIFSGDEASELLERLRSKSVKPVTVFRGPLTLGDPESHPAESLEIPVWVYNKTAEMKLPSAKKWSALAEAISEGERNGATYGAVEMQRTYKPALGDADLQKDQNGQDKSISKDDLVRAYRYGKSLVPFSSEDEEAMKLRTSKGMSILGFVKQSEIPRHHLMSNVLAVVPEPGNTRAAQAFYTLIAALDEKQNAALVRYVRVNDANPKLGVLVPARKGWGWWAQIPFAEDLRPYSFAPLDYLLAEDTSSSNSTLAVSTLSPSNDTQSHTDSPASSNKKKHKLDARQVPADEAMRRMDAFIDAMDLTDAVEDEDGHKREAFRPKDVFNPGWQRLYQCIAYRAIHPDSAELPPVNPQIMACIEPLPDVVEKAKLAAEKLKDAFKITRVEKQKGSGKRAWAARSANRIDAEEVLNRPDNGPAEKRIKVEEPMPENLTDLTTRNVEKVSTVDPIGDFNAMVGRRDIDLVTKAVEQMCDVIVKLVTESFGDQLYDKATNCLVVLRKVSAENDESDQFNNWLRGLKHLLSVGESVRHAPFWRRVVDQQISLITKDEAGDSNVTREEADAFLRAEEEPSAAISRGDEDEVEEEDLLDMMD